MSLWEVEECLALSWNNSGGVFGIRVKTKNHKLEILDAIRMQVEDGNFAPAISEIMGKIMHTSTHLIISGGKIESSVCFDLLLPPMPEPDIKQAIQYELPRYIPCDPMDIVFGYRIIKADKENESKKMLIRVFAILKKDWNELLTDFTSSGVKFDSFVHPFMVLDPLLNEQPEIFLPDVEYHFCYAKKEGSPLRQMIKVEETGSGSAADFEISELAEKLNYDRSAFAGMIKREELPDFIPAMMLAAYAISQKYREDKNHLIPLPKELVPERFRKLRALFMVLLTLTLLLILALIGRNWWEDWSRLSSLKNETAQIQNKIKVLQASNKKLTRLEEKILKELLEADTGNNAITHCLHEISVKMPKEMWLSHFSTRGNSIDMSIRSVAGKQSQIIPVLNSSGLFKTKSSYTRRNSDGTENIYINLDVITSSAKKGGK